MIIAVDRSHLYGQQAGPPLQGLLVSPDAVKKESDLDIDSEIIRGRNPNTTHNDARGM